MVSLYRTLLRLHVEAVWHVRLPHLEKNNVELLQESSLPSWKLYLANMNGDRVAIWHPEVPATERHELLVQADTALSLPFTAPTSPGIHRELALQYTAQPALDTTTAKEIARPLTLEDRELIEAFEFGSAEYFLQPNRQPLIGVVVAERLLSIAHSSRRTTEACELGIDTLPEARRRGYALAATLLWTQAVQKEGLIPIYSTSVDNVASQRLAHAAGYRIFARGVSIEA